MRGTTRFIASTLGLTLLVMVAAPPAMASDDHKPKPKCAFVSVHGQLKLNATGLLKDYPKAQVKTELTVRRNGGLLGGYPTTFKSNTYTAQFRAVGHYVARFTTKSGALKVSCAGTIAPRDNVPPVLTVPANITTPANGPSGALVNFAADVTDDSGSATVSCTPPSGSTFPIGTTTVNCSASDPSGNTSSASFTVTVTPDITPPVLTVPSDISTPATELGGAVVLFTATASDASGPVTPTCIPASGTLFPVDTTLVTCTVSDPSGNSANASFSVTVTPSCRPAPEVLAMQASKLLTC